MRMIDDQYLRTPFFGSRRMTAWLFHYGEHVNRKSVARLMARMGPEAIHAGPRTSTRDPGHMVYPYLLRGLTIDCRDQVWSTDITYILLERGFTYRTAVIDWYSRYVLCWRLSNTLDGRFCLEGLEEALSGGRPAIFNTDQGVQFRAKA
ncbi:DDE-type integrase/transposase/recombinase [Tautonia rosea]|uniref:DDE-type integrase/transposase/recombinase n=1 Tax=Tautonia rosea TaxID=2728037 RepID=UPI0014765625|nr:DDE-type integrase/transposase/recombinase [Tautonia rosea]